jgi:hypothetical protein
MTPLLRGILLAIQGAATSSQAACPLSEVHSTYVGSMGHDVKNRAGDIPDELLKEFKQSSAHR